MSVRYVPVQWNRFKWAYSGTVVLAVVVYVVMFLLLGPLLSRSAQEVDWPIHVARAFGSCAFLMLTVILCIGPCARLDRRFLPALYNRRHFGVLTFLVALSHATAVLGWYFSLSFVPPLQALLSANTSFGQVLGFPIEFLGIFALLCLAALAFTSHDFWLSFLSPPIWKTLHFLIYPAYVAVVGHVCLGALQDQTSPVFAGVVATMAGLVCLLHVAAALRERQVRYDHPGPDGWVEVRDFRDIAEGTAQVLRLVTGERVAVFRHENAFSAISNACAHQNGPLGEGRIVFGCVTCPWHGFQYDLRTGCAPAPFTEKIPTYTLKRAGDRLWLNPVPNPPGSPTEAIPLQEVP